MTKAPVPLCLLAVRKHSQVCLRSYASLQISSITDLRPILAGADIKEMKDLTFSRAYNTNFISSWSSTIPNVRKPIIAAVNGHALGGGCELALMADILYCSSSATFGQPEIKLGIIPGAGGSQRLTAAIGKARAMELILTGKNFSGAEAAQWGVAARVFGSADECVQGALETAERIAKLSNVSVRAAKEVVNKSQETGLREGLDYERKVFHGLFGSRDQKIGNFSNDQSTFKAGVMLILSYRYVRFCREEEAGLVKRIVRMLEISYQSVSAKMLQDRFRSPRSSPLHNSHGLILIELLMLSLAQKMRP